MKYFLSQTIQLKAKIKYLMVFMAIFCLIRCAFFITSQHSFAENLGCLSGAIIGSLIMSLTICLIYAGINKVKQFIASAPQTQSAPLPGSARELEYAGRPFPGFRQ